MDDIEKRIAEIENRVAFLEKNSGHGIGLTLSQAAPLVGVSREGIRSRIKEAIANPNLSTIEEGVHFEKRGRKIVILSISDLKKAIANHDLIFRKRNRNREKSNDHQRSD